MTSRDNGDDGDEFEHLDFEAHAMNANTADYLMHQFIVLDEALATSQRSWPTLSTLEFASKKGTVITYGGKGVFDKVFCFTKVMIAKVEKEAEEAATQKVYCDEEFAKTEAKKTELDDTIAALTAKIYFVAEE